MYVTFKYAFQFPLPHKYYSPASLSLAAPVLLLVLVHLGLGLFGSVPVVVVGQQNFQVCIAIPDLTNVLDPLSCDNYYICSGGVGLFAPCPGDTWFDPVNQVCADPSIVECHLFASTPVTPTRDPNVEDGIFCPATDNPFVMQFIPSLIDCERYYICYHGQPMSMRCLEGFYWNQAARMCDYPINANCAVSVPNVWLTFIRFDPMDGWMSRKCCVIYATV